MRKTQHFPKKSFTADSSQQVHTNNYEGSLFMCNNLPVCLGKLQLMKLDVIQLPLMTLLTGVKSPRACLEGHPGVITLYNSQFTIHNSQAEVVNCWNKLISEACASLF
ncbi:hypothetical protein H5410_007798 [Solanum commersonii]|uniref:Uncharacterized protein n=1 Tax=Solanum commersonii TaxID=4109 RepID=A0A9J6AE72_SOLCO|nr:hypothetical protein H5410_007798 [Solanum commersonii]